MGYYNSNLKKYTRLQFTGNDVMIFQSPCMKQIAVYFKSIPFLVGEFKIYTNNIDKTKVVVSVCEFKSG